MCQLLSCWLRLINSTVVPSSWRLACGGVFQAIKDLIAAITQTYQAVSGSYILLNACVFVSVCVCLLYVCMYAYVRLFIYLFVH